MVDEVIKKKVHTLYILNRQKIQEGIYTAPSVDTYPYQWSWDSCFHAIVLSYLEPKVGLSELDLLINTHVNPDFIPHIIFRKDPPQVGDLHYYDWGMADGSSIIQPPLLSIAMGRLYKAVDDEGKAKIKKLLDDVSFHYDYINNNRIDETGVAFIINPDESGLDNLPSYDADMDLPPQHLLAEHLKKRTELVAKYKKYKFKPHKMKSDFYIYDVLFNTVLVQEWLIYADLLREVGELEKSSYWSKQVKNLKSSLRDMLLTEEGEFMNKNYDREVSDIKTWTLLAPLFAGLYSEDEAEKVVNTYLLNPSAPLITKYGIPSVSTLDPSFVAQPAEPIIGGFWRGPVWPLTQWMIYHGLKKYGYDDCAQQLKSQQINLIEESGFRECYNPINGEGLAARGFTWGGLILDMN